jgi:hypothetical protein
VKNEGELILSVKIVANFRRYYYLDGGAFRAVPELLFEKKGLIPRVKQLLVEGSAASEPS